MIKYDSNRIVYKEGDVVKFDEGEYYDMTDYGVYLVLKSFDWYKLLDEYLEENPEEAIDHQADYLAFIKYLSHNEYIKVYVNPKRHNIGSYGIWRRYKSEDSEE